MAREGVGEEDHVGWGPKFLVSAIKSPSWYGGLVTGCVSCTEDTVAPPALKAGFRLLW